MDMERRGLFFLYVLLVPLGMTFRVLNLDQHASFAILFALFLTF